MLITTFTSPSRHKADFVSAVRLDQLGMLASGLCALHCLLMPLVVGVLPLLGLSRLADERTEWALIGLALALGLWSLLPGFWRQHRRGQPLLLFALGLGLIFSARWWGEEFWLWETLGVVSGSVLLATAHALNLRYCCTYRGLTSVSG